MFKFCSSSTDKNVTSFLYIMIPAEYFIRFVLFCFLTAYVSNGGYLLVQSSKDPKCTGAGVYMM